MNGTAAEVIQFDWAEYTVFSLTLMFSAMIGVYFGFFKGGQDTVTEYLLGGKKMPVFPIAMSLVSSATSGITLLGVATETYKYGTQYLIATLSLFGVAIVTSFIFLPVLFKLQLLSLYQYFELRFHRRVRIVTSILYFISMLNYVPIVMYGPSLALNQVSGINMHLITLVLCVICIFYTTVGGLKAVVWSDALQGGIMIFSVVAVTVIGAMKAGGFPNVFQAAFAGNRIEFFNMDPDPTLRISFWSVSIGLWFFWTGEAGISPAAVQRYIAVPTLKKAQWCAMFLCLGSAFFVNISGMIGLVMYAYYKNCDPYIAQGIDRPDQILPNFVMEVTGNIRGLPGLFLAGIVCAALSSMSTCLNTLAGMLYEDFVEPALTVKVSEARASQIIKVLVVVIGTICAAMVLVIEKLGGVLDVALSFGGISVGSILGLFLLGMFFPMANVQGATWGGLVGLGVMGWLIVGNRIYKIRGLINHPELPVSVDGCPFNVSHLVPPPPPLEALDCAYIFPLYKISMFYYSVCGCFIVVTVGVIVSYLTGPNKAEDVNPDLLSPLIHKYLPQKKKQYTIVPLRDLSINNSGQSDVY